MTVTRIEPVSASRMKIYLDEDIAFVLYKGELRLFGIKEGEELPEHVWKKIREQVLLKRACLRCMNLLKERSYTYRQLYQKLLSGGCSEDIAEAALDYVSSYGYVDDDRYARDYIFDQHDKKSRRQIEEVLLRRGISREQIRAAFEQTEQLGDGVNEEALARQLLAKKHYTAASADYKERQRAAAYLYRKGICMDVIRGVLDCCDDY